MLAEINRLAETSEKNDGGRSDQVDASITSFRVSNPQKIGKTIKYTVSGKDSEGDFEVVRRYNEFDALRQVLSIRWPGCYIPYIPEKKLDFPDVGNQGKIDSSEAKFIEERRALLERFVRELARHDFLVESREFKIFARQPGEVDTMLKNLPIQTPDP